MTDIRTQTLTRAWHDPTDFVHEDNTRAEGPATERIAYPAPYHHDLRISEYKHATSSLICFSVCDQDTIEIIQSRESLASLFRRNSLCLCNAIIMTEKPHRPRMFGSYDHLTASAAAAAFLDRAANPILHHYALPPHVRYAPLPPPPVAAAEPPLIAPTPGAPFPQGDSKKRGGNLSSTAYYTTSESPWLPRLLRLQGAR